MLVEQPLPVDLDAVVPDRILQFVDIALPRGKAIDCFDFVCSDSSHVWRAFSALEKGRLCEWGSGIGIATGIARMVGHEATGIEINENLAAESRRVLHEFDLDCDILHGSYFNEHVEADYYFVYCWPGKMIQVQQHFENVAPAHAKLLICHGAEDIRCKVRES